ncbi:uncharacterized protein LOC122003055 [Zingiber officinale]|uniref:Uncharacterized protein n=1 Tax=Zingiber officinale TaxID=94328 RepID=A0A8J5KXQ7_ZINOF|nr:uncharacterized protein LOC122003055 [Zingiber officinale]KAG6494508.1 hypothetical protein ZIOFF_049540 [Zingiber officinale]
MASQMLKAKDESMPETKQFHQQKKRITTQIHSSKSPSKSSSPSRIKNIDFLEKVGALKTEKLPRQTAKDRGGIKNSVISSLGTPQKPWPGRKVPEMDETVKNMSNVPFYLQRTEKGDSIHEKALNVGVLEWGLLERWTHLQKCGTDARGGDSSSKCTESTMFSTYDFSSPLYQRKKSSVLDHKKHSFPSSPTMMQEEEVYRPIEAFSNSRFSSIMLPSQHDNHLDVVFDPLGHKNDKDICTGLDSEGAPVELRLGSHSTTSPSRDNTDQATVISIGEDHDCSSTNIIPLAKDTMPLFDDNEEIWGFLQHSADGKQPCSGSTITTDCWQSNSNSKSHSGNLVEDFEIIYRFSEVPHSCPLPLAIVNDEPNVSCDVPSVGVAPTDKPVQGNGGIPSASCEKLESCTTQKPRKYEAKAIASAGKKSTVYPSSTGANRMSRSSSLKAGSSEELFESISFLYNSHGEQVTRNSKGRQSPLRRLLDPIMKPKNNLHSTGKVADLPGHYSGELQTDKSFPRVNKPLNTTFRSMCQTRESVITSKELPYNGKGTQNDKNYATMMKQALLHLAWKNGLPLFMLSCDGEVLAAAITTTSTSNIDNLECIFTIFSIDGSKKKNTFWHNSGNKCKQHQLISNVVGQLNVALGEVKSLPYGSFDSVREFVLLDASKSVDSRAVSELAAMVVQKPPSRKPNLWTISAANGEKSLNSDQHNAIGQSSISVIIPSGIHGLATDGEPSSLIERWRSGGVCDCGGWDEGCTLNILSNKFQEHNSCGSFQPCQTTNGTHRLELFTQGASRETRQAFSMVSCQEGLYTVDFQSSISLLQAFAICLAVIHGKRYCISSAPQKSLQEHIVNDRLGKYPTTHAGNPNSYVPNHPPVSPVGRT